MIVTPPHPVTNIYPCIMSYNRWALEHFDEVYMVSITFPPWSPSSVFLHEQPTFAYNRGQYRNCGGQDRNVQPCQNLLFNPPRVLNSSWGELNDWS